MSPAAFCASVDGAWSLDMWVSSALAQQPPQLRFVVIGSLRAPAV